MGVREQLNRHPGRSLGVAVGVLLIAGSVFAWQIFGGSSTTPNSKMFLTTDDGKTSFSYNGDHLPPLEVEGKQAYRAVLFTCDGGKTRWVGYLVRYVRPNNSRRGDPQQKAEPIKRSEGTGGPSMDVIEVKRPGESEWVKGTDPRAGVILQGKCPHGGEHTPEPLFP